MLGNSLISLIVDDFEVLRCLVWENIEKNGEIMLINSKSFAGNSGLRLKMTKIHFGPFWWKFQFSPWTLEKLQFGPWGEIEDSGQNWGWIMDKISV